MHIASSNGLLIVVESPFIDFPAFGLGRSCMERICEKGTVSVQIVLQITKIDLEL